MIIVDIARQVAATRELCLGYGITDICERLLMDKVHEQFTYELWQIELLQNTTGESFILSAEINYLYSRFVLRLRRSNENICHQVSFDILYLGRRKDTKGLITRIINKMFNMAKINLENE